MPIDRLINAVQTGTDQISSGYNALTDARNRARAQRREDLAQASALGEKVGLAVKQYGDLRKAKQVELDVKQVTDAANLAALSNYDEPTTLAGVAAHKPTTAEGSAAQAAAIESVRSRFKQKAEIELKGAEARQKQQKYEDDQKQKKAMTDAFSQGGSTGDPVWDTYFKSGAGTPEDYMKVKKEIGLNKRAEAKNKITQERYTRLEQMRRDLADAENAIKTETNELRRQELTQNYDIKKRMAAVAEEGIRIAEMRLDETASYHDRMLQLAQWRTEMTGYIARLGHEEWQDSSNRLWLKDRLEAELDAAKEVARSIRINAALSDNEDEQKSQLAEADKVIRAITAEINLFKSRPVVQSPVMPAAPDISRIKMGVAPSAAPASATPEDPIDAELRRRGVIK